MEEPALLQNPMLNKETCKNNALLEEHTSKMQRTMTKLIFLGRNLVWKPRCEALIKHQRILGIFKRDKHPDRSTFCHSDAIAEDDTSLKTPSGPWVRIN